MREPDQKSFMEVLGDNVADIPPGTYNRLIEALELTEIIEKLL